MAILQMPTLQSAHRCWPATRRPPALALQHRPAVACSLPPQLLASSAGPSSRGQRRQLRHQRLDAAGVAIQTGSFSMEAMWRTSTVRVDLDAPESAASVVVHSVWGVSSTPLAFTCAR